jgi:hypothetical protein
VKIGDMIQLGNGPVGHYGLASHAVVLVKKRGDQLCLERRSVKDIHPMKHRKEVSYL